MPVSVTQAVKQTNLGIENTYLTEMCSGSKDGSYLGLIDIFEALNSRLECNKEEEPGH